MTNLEKISDLSNKTRDYGVQLKEWETHGRHLKNELSKLNRALLDLYQEEVKK